MGRLYKYFWLIVIAIVIFSCRKTTTYVDPAPPPPAGDTVSLSYGDSIFYVSGQDNDLVISPVGSPSGRYFGFPEGIELDPETGTINVNKSETGLRYRISFIPNGRTDTLSTIILLSGISYLDQIYELDKDDTLAPPVYNASVGAPIPGANGGSVFDEGGGCNALGIAVSDHDARINLAQTVRNGVFGDEPKNGAQKEVEMLYRINDKSGKSLNKLKVKLYYFDSPDKIDADLVEEMNERRDMFLGINLPPFLGLNGSAGPSLMVSSNSTLATARPRPPCIFLTGKVSKH